MAEADLLDEHGQDLSDPGRRRRVDALSTEGVQGRAEFLAGGPVGSGKDVQAQTDLNAYLVVGEVEDPIERDLVAVENPGEQPFDPDGLAFTEPL